MTVRALSVLWLLFLLSPTVPAQVYVCDFGDAHPDVLVRNIVFKAPVQLSPDSQRALRESILHLSEQTHSQAWADTLPEDAQELVREAYEDNGFFQVSVTGNLRRVSDRGDLHTIEFIFQIVPGSRYRVGSTVWKGNSAVSASELDKAFAIRIGQTFGRQRIVHGLGAVKNLYLSHGYINNSMVPYPNVDEATKVVSFEIDIDEGKQFRFGELATHGIEDQHRQVMLSAWNDLRGKACSSEKADEFFGHFFKPLRPGISPKDYTERYINEATGLVNYSISLTRNPALDTAAR